MPFPIELYYPETQGKTVFTNQPRNNIDINELISGRDAFIDNGYTKVFHPKTLIITDWTAKKWFSDEVAAIKEIILELLEHDFSIYVWQSGFLTALTKQDLHKLNSVTFRAKIKLSVQNAVYQEAKTQLGVPKGKIHLLDNYWLSKLGQGNKSIERTLHLSDYLFGCDPMQLLGMLKESSPPVTKIVNDKIEDGNTKHLRFLKQFFPNARIVTIVTQLALDTKNIEKFSIGKPIQIYGTSLQISEITDTILTIKTAGKASLTSLKFFIQACSKLKYLSINKVGDKWKDIFPLLKNKKIERLELTEATLDSEDISYILGMKDLRQLKLNECQVKDCNINQKNYQLPHLDFLETDLNYKTTPNKRLLLETIISISPELRTAIFTSYSMGQLHLNVGLPSLNEFLLKQSSKLESLPCLQLHTDHKTSLKPMSLPNIKAISILNSGRLGEIGNANLLNILEACPNLESFDSEGLNLDFSIVKKITQYKNLKSLTLYNMSFDKREFVSFLQAIPLIQTLKLHNITVKDDFILPVQSLPKLRELQFHHRIKKDGKPIHFSAHNFISLLRASPNLDELGINGSYPGFDFKYKFCSEIVEAIASHPNIKQIIFDDVNITLKQLQRIISTSTSIESVEIDYCRNLFMEKLKLKPNSLQQLKTIIFPDSESLTLATADLQLMIKQSPTFIAVNFRADYYYPSLANDQKKFFNLYERDFMDGWDPDSKSGSISDDVYAEDAEHDPQDFVDHAPNDKDTPFVYRGMNKTKNQAMIIEQFSQFLTFTPQIEIIPKIQDGICMALSFLFHQTRMQQWQSFLKIISEWDGKQESLNKNLVNFFKFLHLNIKKHQFSPLSTAYYLGNKLEFILKVRPSLVLANPWHAIAVRPHGGDHWQIYDPNFTDGVKIVANDSAQRVIQRSLGELVSILHAFTSINAPLAKITDFNRFFQKGGLLVLRQCSNYSQILQQFSALKVKTLSQDALKGLFLRDVIGHPAWVKGLKNHNLNPLTQTLMKQWLHSHPNTGINNFKRSLDAVPENKRLEIMTVVIKTVPAQSKLRALLLQSLRSSRPNVYEKHFQTWNKQKAQSNLNSYCHKVCQDITVKKRLIEMPDNNAINALILTIQAHAKRMNQPVFYAHEPKDLLCSGTYMHRHENGRGELKKGPGGPLHDFLTRNRGGVPLLIVKYNNFDAEDIVRFNALLDDSRRADGSELPPNTIIIGVINPQKPDCYQGEDFYSRFDVVDDNPVPIAALIKSTAILNHAIAEKTPSSEPSANIINLYHRTDWKSRLLGHWSLDGDCIYWQEGQLQNALKKGNLLEVKNGLWGDEAFDFFWQQALKFKTIQHQGSIIHLPNDFKILSSKHEGFQPRQDRFDIIAHLEKQSIVINPANVGQLYDGYAHQDNKLFKEKGVIEKSKGNTLSLHITRNLNDETWEEMLDLCQKHRVRLQISFAPGVTLPEGLHSDFIPKSTFAQQPWAEATPRAASIIVSTDMDTTVAQLDVQHNPPLIIDVTECTMSDLLYCIKPEFNEVSLRFTFKKESRILLQALNNQRHVILKGHFSHALVDDLASFLLSRSQEKAPQGRLDVICDKPDLFNFLPCFFHRVTAEEKVVLLRLLDLDENELKIIQPLLEQEPLSRLQARCDYLRSKHTGDSAGAWVGFDGLIAEKHPDFDVKNSASKASLLTKSRLNAINTTLSYAPYAFITGLTGVGKSTFVETELRQHVGSLHIGESKLTAWASDASAGRKILFLDEANLSHRQWSEFKGLFNKHPAILIDGKYYPLTPEHKVIFAGNPVNYGDERKLADFFVRHGNAVLFKPLSAEFIYEKILKPVFANTNIQNRQQDLCTHILRMYQYIVNLSQTHVLISPREIQMMALMAVDYCQRKTSFKTSEVEMVLQKIMYDLAQNLVPTAHKEEFDVRFKPRARTPMPREGIKNLSAFTITSSRVPLITQLHNFLNVQQSRNLPNKNTSQQYGGLGGLIVEGSPGIGKSELVVKVLVAKGYREVCDMHQDCQESRIFCRIPVSMPLGAKKQLLLDAFDKGAVVIIDEINSSPMLEQLLNALLMGKKPNGAFAKNPGFMIIGTQNPDSMAGRRKPSTALSRRLSLNILPDYSRQEMVEILVAKGLDQEPAKALVKAYCKQLDYALIRNLKPIPTFRDLLRVSEKVKSKLDVMQRKEQSLLTSFFPKKRTQAADDARPPKRPCFTNHSPLDGSGFLLLFGILSSANTPSASHLMTGEEHNDTIWQRDDYINPK